MMKMTSCPFCGEEHALGVKTSWFRGRLAAMGRCKTCNAQGPMMAIPRPRNFEVSKEEREELIESAVIQWNNRRD